MKNVLTTTFQNFQMWVSENFSFKFFAGTQRIQKCSQQEQKKPK